VNGIATAYTITNDPAIDDGTRRVIFFPVSDGDTLEVGFTEGAMPEEHSLEGITISNGEEDNPAGTIVDRWVIGDGIGSGDTVDANGDFGTVPSVPEGIIEHQLVITVLRGQPEGTTKGQQKETVTKKHIH
ncbi:MAG: hypothetical protein AAF597_12060, partial [Bacteroidota bacterium]